MARETLDRKINHLHEQILILDSMVEDAILQSIDALKKQDIEHAQQIYAFDKTVNAKRFEIENDCITTIATQQPIMARDLRLLASILEVAAELERMGDYAKGIAIICLRIGKEQHIKPLIDIPRMAELSVNMLHRSVGAFVRGDTETAIEAYQTALDKFELYNTSNSLNPGAANTSRAFAYIRLATVAEDLGLLEPAMNYYSAAVAAAPDAPWTHVTHGDALRRRNDHQNAAVAQVKLPEFGIGPGLVPVVGKSSGLIPEVRRFVIGHPFLDRPFRGMIGSKVDLPVPFDRRLDFPTPAFVRPGSRNLAVGKPVTSSVADPVIGRLAQITDKR